MKLYHATYGCYKDNILKEGLCAHPENSAWWSSDYKKFFDEYPIFLAIDPELAISFVEAADIDEDVYKTGYCVFEVRVDEDKLLVDPFWHNNFEEDEIDSVYDIDNYAVQCFVHVGSIAPDRLTFLKEGHL